MARLVLYFFLLSGHAKSRNSSWMGVLPNTQEQKIVWIRRRLVLNPGHLRGKQAIYSLTPRSLDLTPWPLKLPIEPSPPFSRLQFLFHEIFTETHSLGWTDTGNLFLGPGPWPQVWGYQTQKQKVPYNLWRLVWFFKPNFSSLGQTVWLPVKDIRTRIQADSHLSYIDSRASRASNCLINFKH